MNGLNFQFQNVMSSSGLTCPELPHANTEKFQRFGTLEDNGKKPCWYRLTVFPNGFAVGSFGCFKRNIKEVWYSKDLQLLSEQQRKDVKKQLEKNEQLYKVEQQDCWSNAAKKSESIWSSSSEASDNHQYLQTKRVKNFGLKLGATSDLIIPLLDNKDKLHGLQFITLNGNKKFLPGTNKLGHYYEISGDESIIYVAEGYATVASIHQATGNTVIVAFDAGNLLSVSKVIKGKYSRSEIVIAADNDQFADVNIGVKKATEAAKAIGAKVVMPQFKNLDSNPTDFNDLMILEGIDEVRRQLDQYYDTSIDTNENDRPRTSSASKVIELMNDTELFHDSHQITYATIEHGGHKETWRLDSKNFQDWLSHKFWSKHYSALSKTVLQNALITLDGKALYDGECHEVYTRIAMLDGVIYINLANENWEIVKVTNSGWEVLQNSPLKFTRTSHMQALPSPLRNGDFNLFWNYVNIPEEYHKIILAFILECLRPDTPYPVLVLNGMQGSAKSTTQEFLRMLIDPSGSNLRGAPKKSEDLFVAAANNDLVSFNNVSHLSEAMQDDLCCLATGGAYGTRELYTTSNEAVVNIKRPVIINGIGDFITAQDLIDRCLILELPEINEQTRKTEGEIKRDFNLHYPEIFGGLLNILSLVLKELPSVKLPRKPRMADFALLGTALEKVMGWGEGSFMADYAKQRKDNLSSAMEHSPVAIALLNFMEHDDWYEGSFARLFNQLSLSKFRPEMSGWPKSPKGLSNQIKRQKAALEACDLKITFDPQRHEDGYYIAIKRLVKQVQDVQQVQSPATDKGYRAEHIPEYSSLRSDKFSISSG